jgi:photosynthetic reaction center cytochrome c subunit
MSLKNAAWVFLCVLLSVALSLWVSSAESSQTATQQTGPQEPKPAEQVYKNIRVFKGLPAPQLLPTMRFIAGSLGVPCTHCHVPEQFEKDDKPAKQAARQMIQMMAAINKENFESKREVNCYTCHRGSPKPESIPAVMQASAPPKAEAKPVPAAVPSVEQILAKYAEALGGRAAAEKLTSRVEKGFLEVPGGFRAPIEMERKAPNKSLVTISTPQGATHQSFNGTAGWVLNPQNKTPRDLTGAELDRARREAQFYGDFELRRNYAQMKVVGIERVGDREVYLIRAVPAAGSVERLYFDTQTGLLMRSVLLIETPLGFDPTQTDYEDYREVDGVKLAFRTRTARPNSIVTVKWDEVKHNVPLDDARFEKPSAP